MQLDALLEFSDAQALTVTAVSTNVIPVDSVQQIGIGRPMTAVVTIGVDADFTTTDETYQFVLQTATDAAFTSPVTVYSSAAINGDELTAGTKVLVPIGQTNLAFFRMNYVLAGTTPTVTVDAYLAPLEDVSGYVQYPNNYTIV